MTEDQLEQETLAWLTELSNILFPRLISGQLRVAEAQTTVEKVFA